MIKQQQQKKLIWSHFIKNHKNQPNSKERVNTCRNLLPLGCEDSLPVRRCSLDGSSFLQLESLGGKKNTKFNHKFSKYSFITIEKSRFQRKALLYQPISSPILTGLVVVSPRPCSYPLPIVSGVVLVLSSASPPPLSPWRLCPQVWLPQI